MSAAKWLRAAALYLMLALVASERMAIIWIMPRLPSLSPRRWQVSHHRHSGDRDAA